MNNLARFAQDKHKFFLNCQALFDVMGTMVADYEKNKAEFKMSHISQELMMRSLEMLWEFARQTNALSRQVHGAIDAVANQSPSDKCKAQAKALLASAS